MVKYGKIYSTMVKIYMMIMFLLQLDILTRLDPIGVKLFLHFFSLGNILLSHCCWPLSGQNW